MRAWSLLLVGCVACSARLPAPGQIGIPVKLTTRIDARIDLRVQGQVNVQGQGQVQPPPPPPPPPVQIVAVENAPVPEFFGISLEGAQDVVFVLDVSGSMDERAFGRLAQIHVSPPPVASASPAGPPPPPPDPNAPPPPPPDPNAPPPDPNAPPVAAPAPAPEPPAPRKIDVAQSELIAALRQLPVGTRMNVLFFNDALDAYAPSFVVLDEATRSTLITFVDDSEPMGSTALAPAMRTAFVMNARRIVLLSDGLGNIGGNADAVMRDAREAMRGGVRIDTIGLGAGQDARLLGALAKESGGLYQAM